MAVSGLLTTFALPIQEMRDFIKASMVTAFGGGLSSANVAARTIYFDQDALKPLMDRLDGAAAIDGFTELYMVKIPGIGSRGESFARRGYEYSVPVSIYICRKVNDNPHSQATTMVTRAGTLVVKLIPQKGGTQPSGHRWTGCTGMKRCEIEEVTMDFPEAQQLHSKHWTAVLIRATVKFYIEGY